MNKLKKVKIDEHIKNSKIKASASPTPRKRGRPRKVALDGNAQNGDTNTFREPIGSDQASINNFNGQSDHGEGIDSSIPQSVEPIYDTTPEAKGLLQTPFAILAMFLKNEQLALSEPETEALIPTFKPIYDEDIKPMMGTHAKYIAFASVFSVVLIQKVQIINQMKKESDRLEKAKREFDQTIKSPNQTEIPVSMAL